MDNISAISECKPKGNYAVSYANAQTFKGGAVSLDTPVDTFTKQNNKHTKSIEKFNQNKNVINPKTEFIFKIFRTYIPTQEIFE